MLTKTYRAQNMLMALKDVQADLGPDALIISMREVPSGPLWAAWRKPGVEVIATKSAKETGKKDSSIPEQLTDKKQMERKSPTRDELKAEIENLKSLMLGSNDRNTSTPLPVVDVVKSNQIEKLSEDKKQFDPSDFKSYPESQKQEIQKINTKTESALSKFDSIIIEKVQDSVMPPVMQELKQKLIAQGVNRELVDKIINTNLESLSPSILADYSRLDRFIKHQLSVCLPPSRKSLALVPSKVMVLAGTSGSGKTSSCAKLAAFYTITMGKKVVWIEADTIKTSAISEARTYAETLGIPLFLAYTPQELSELVLSQKDADLILVDTACFNPRKEDSILELGSFLSSVPSGSIYFVASSTTQENDLLQAGKTLKQFGVKGVILTKTDETGSFGSSFNLVWQSKLPIYFFSMGIQIFGDLKNGNPEDLAAAVVDGYLSRK